jgi:hypothetical protein
MAIKKQASSPTPLVGRAEEHPLDAVGPLALSAATVASEGIVRAAFDAVREHPLTARSTAAARAAGREVMERHMAATASLARRSAEAHARSVAAFVKPDRAKPTPPPF